MAAILAPLVVVAALFVALAAASDAPADCPSFTHHRRAVRAIQTHGVGHGLSCAEVRRALDRWIDARFAPRVGGWRFAYRADCSCHVATRRLADGRAQRFVFN